MNIRTMHGQAGNTLTGIVIGLVIGLGIAVVVALLITKSATPFTNKGGKNDKADTTPMQLQDPNKPLYGPNASVKEPAAQPAKETPKEPVTAAAPAKPGEVKVELKPGADKPAVVVADANKIDAAEDKSIYYLQVGAFKEHADAESSRARLALLGFEAKVSEKTSDTGTVYRVRIGPFNNAETLNRIRSRLSENGIDVAIARTNR